MRRHARPATSALAAVVLAGALSGCSDDSGEQRADPTGGQDGDIPAAPVLPDDLAVSQDGSEVLADCWEGICRWDTTDGRLDRVDDGSHVAISPDWSLIAGVGDAASVVLVEPESGDVVRELEGHVDEQIVDGSPIRDIAFSPDGSLVASAGADGTLIVWSVADGSDVLTLETDAATLAFSPDGERLAAGGERIRVFDVPSGAEVASLPGSTASAAGLAWSPDGRWLAGSGPEGAAALWDTDEFALAAEFPGGTLRDLAFSPDSRRVAVATTDGTSVWLWAPTALSGPGDDVRRELVGHTSEPGALAFAPDGLTLYSVAGTDGILAWEVARATLREKFELPER